MTPLGAEGAGCSATVLPDCFGGQHLRLEPEAPTMPLKDDNILRDDTMIEMLVKKQLGHKHHFPP